MISSGDRSLSLESLRTRAARAATTLAHAGVAAGGVVAILLRNDIAFVEAVLAAERIGAYSVPINFHSTADEVRYILADARARVLVVHADLLRRVAGGIPDHTTVVCVRTPDELRAAYGIAAADAEPPAAVADWEDRIARNPAWTEPSRAARGRMIYTSGTTGRPKGVRRFPVTDEARSAYARLHREWFGFRPAMRTAVIGPMYHSVQATYAMGAIASGGTAVLLPRFDAETVLRLIHEERLTHLHLVPIMMRRLLQLSPTVRRRYDVSSLEFVIHGAAPCPPDVKRALIDWWGPKIHEYYGTTEAGMVSRSDSHEWLARPGTVGRAWPGRTIRIYDDHGATVAPGTEGEVYFSLGAMPDFTYQNADDRRAEIERDGLVTNGDVGYLDADGYLFLCDRKRDVVISGGANVYPAEIEAALSSHPDVGDCAVFGVPDDEYGEALAAVVQPRPGAALSEEELRAFLAPRLARFKIPREFAVVGDLPRQDSGKIFKRVLRDARWAGTGRRI